MPPLTKTHISNLNDYDLSTTRLCFSDQIREPFVHAALKNSYQWQKFPPHLNGEIMQ
jgi:hypothetical protein